MSVSESDRNDVYQALAAVWAQSIVDLVMELLFTQPTTELVTQQDLHANTVLLRGEMAELRADLKGEMAELRADMTELRSELKGEVSELRGEIKAEIGNLYRWGAGVMVANGLGEDLWGDNVVLTHLRSVSRGVGTGVPGKPPSDLAQRIADLFSRRRAV